MYFTNQTSPLLSKSAKTLRSCWSVLFWLTSWSCWFLLRISLLTFFSYSLSFCLFLFSPSLLNFCSSFLSWLSCCSSSEASLVSCSSASYNDWLTMPTESMFRLIILWSNLLIKLFTMRLSLCLEDMVGFTNSKWSTLASPDPGTMKLLKPEVWLTPSTSSKFINCT